MKEIEIKQSFIDRFKTLNAFSGINFLAEDFSNVNFNDNSIFNIPDDNRFFDFNFFSDEPEQIGVMNDDYQERYTGFVQIDICTPLDVGEAESNNKANWIYKLFATGTTFDDVSITSVYKEKAVVEENYYRVIIRVYYDADITNR